MKLRYTSRSHNPGKIFYRNPRAIMRVMGVVTSLGKNNIFFTNKNVREQIGGGPSTHSQFARFLSYFYLTTEWHDRQTEFELNEDGIRLKDLLLQKYSPDELINWDQDIPDFVIDFYIDILKKENGYKTSPLVRWIFIALYMAFEGDLFKLTPESRKSTQKELDIIDYYFARKTDAEDLSWMNWLTRTLEEFRLIECNKEINNTSFYWLTPTGHDLVASIVDNWSRDLPSISTGEISDNDVDKFIQQIDTENISPKGLELVEGLPKIKKTKKQTQKKQSKSRRVNWSQVQDSNKKTGEIGEELVMQLEKEKLEKSKNYKHLANEIVHESKVNGDGAGYDIKSYDADTGQEIYLEVKTTTQSFNTAFYMTKNERDFMENNKDKLFVYRLFNLVYDPHFAKYIILTSQQISDSYFFEPSTFNVKRKIN